MVLTPLCVARFATTDEGRDLLVLEQEDLPVRTNDGFSCGCAHATVHASECARSLGGLCICAVQLLTI